MPAYKNPLYIAASDYINGLNSSDLTASELASLGHQLLSSLDDQIARVHSTTLLIGRQLDEMDAAGLGMADKKLDACMRVSPILDRTARQLSHLVRASHKIKEMRETDLSIRNAILASDGSQASRAGLMDGYIRSSKKLAIFYSKLFRKNMDLTDRQWKLIESFFPPQIKEGAGRPPQPSRAVLNGILWKLRTGASWDDLPLEYPSHQTCYRYFNKWMKDGALDNALRVLKSDLAAHGLDLFQAIQSSDIELIRVSRRMVIGFVPRLQDTWQGSTALLLLQVHLSKLRRGGRIPKKTTPVFTTVMDAMETMQNSQKP